MRLLKLDGNFYYGGILFYFISYCQSELEDSDEKAAPEVADARNTIVEVEKVFETTEA